MRKPTFYAMPFSLRNLTHTHSFIKDEQEHEEDVIENLTIVRIGTYRLAFCAFMLAATAGSLGFWAGQRTFFQCQLSKATTAEKQNEFHSDKYSLRTFDYNQTFAQAPSPESDKAWESLFPGELS